VVDLRFAPGSLTAVTPAWQLHAERRAALTQQYALPLIVLALLIVVGGSLLAHVFWRRSMPDLLRDDAPITTPPSALSPALAGALASGQGEPGAPTALATLFDLAERGVVEFTQTDEKNWLGRPAPVFQVALRERPANLAPHEQQLLDEFFGPAAAPGTTVPLTKQVTALINHWKRFAEPLKATLRARGWWDAERARQRVGWLLISLLLIFASIGLLIAAAALRDTLGDFIFLVPLASFALGFVLLILASRISPYSDAGRAEAARWQRFQRYLGQIVANKEAVTRPDLFAHYLAYATALGLAHGWVSFFQKRGEANIPAWFQPLADSGNAGFIALIAVIASSGGTAGAAGVGAGAAGGGASGTG
jgi:hypothetical protein